MFKSLFPSIHKFITLYKSEYGDYKILAYELQKMESNLIFNKIIRSIVNANSKINVITVHDSIIVKRKYKEVVNAIFQSKLLDEFDF